MNLMDAIKAHVGWKVRLENYVSGDRSEDLNSAIIAQDNQCALGKWIYGEGAIYNDLPDFSEMKRNHAAFHQCAAAIVQKCDEGKVSEAETMLHQEYNRVSQRVKKSLAKLGMHVLNENSGAGTGS